MTLQESASAPMILARKFLSAKARWRMASARRTGRYAGRHVLSAENTNLKIAQLLRQGAPVMVTRFGTSELAVWANYQGIVAGTAKPGWRRWASQANDLSSTWSSTVCSTFHHNAGFFPVAEEYLQRYAQEMRTWLAAADLMAVWFDRWEEMALRTQAPQAELGQFMGLEPYVHDSPWTLALDGRRVLVVHPFADSIARQFARRDRLFGSKRVLPDFDLVTLNAVQSIGNAPVEFPDWFAALDSMKVKISAERFDVAIIGAGAYGMALAAFVKDLGRQAVHLGGSTQLLFGIKGKRWDVRPEVANFYNSEWVRPLPHEVPQNAASIENGCYW